MTRPRAVLVSALALLVGVAACEQPRQLLGPDGGSDSPQLGHGPPAACHPTGTGLTARVVNQDVIGGTIDVGDCDVGAFFDEDGVVRNATFVQPDADVAAPNLTDSNGHPVQNLVRVEGAKVDVRSSSFDVAADYRRQVLHIAYVDGATGTIAGNELTGFKRAGILLDGAGTEAVVKRNHIEGVGPKTSGWAENGIQLSGGATGAVTDNRVSSHWWDKRDFCSSGIILFGADDVTVRHNRVAGSDCGIVLVGGQNNAHRNHVVVQHRGAATLGFFGVWILGDENAVRRNIFRSHPVRSADIGVLDSGADNSVARNLVNGFSEGVIGGDPERNVVTPAGPAPDELPND